MGYKEAKKENELLKNENMAIKCELLRVNHKLEDLEQSMVNKKIIVDLKDYQYKENDDIESKVTGKIETDLNISVQQKWNIERLGKSPSKFVVELPNESIKSQLFKSVAQKKLKSLYITEYLIKNGSQLLLALKTLKRENPSLLYKAYSFKGKIYIKYQKEGSPVHVRDINDVQFPSTSQGHENTNSQVNKTKQRRYPTRYHGNEGLPYAQ